MSAPKNNKFWQKRSKHGTDKIFQSNEILWESACEYFEWVEDNPLKETKTTQYQGAQVDMVTPKMRAMTIEGFCLFLGIARSTWYNYTQVEDFMDICTRIEQVIKTQKFEGAAADIFNASIIARDLGLADKREIENKNSYEDATEEEIELAIAELTKKLNLNE